jgi:hypothetical protein
MSLREKFIAAYEASELKQQDIERRKALIAEIARFFARTKLVLVMINDNPFRIGDLIFYASELSDSNGVYGYQLAVSRRCDACKEYIEQIVNETFVEAGGQLVNSPDGSLSALEFGRWLTELHLCEFSLEERKRVKGFARA